ncbi:AraC family transcriptional regulator [Paenibacillus sp. GCM10028914]|uniref:helix-turn-helix transcriptional regulator n=1 Tax=Paenibacillus sp. GCM10028914 TaxID=3273416 RepID=UPI0036242151
MARPEGFSTHQLLFSRKGEGRVRLSGQEEFTFGPMQYMLLPAALPHEYFPVSDEAWEVGYISFSGTKVDTLLEHFGLEFCQLQEMYDADRIWSVLDELWKIADENQEGSEWVGARILYSLLLDLNRMRLNDEQIKLEPAISYTEDVSREVVLQAANYLNEHYNENISLANMASSLGYTHQYLNKLFHKTYGMSMLQYVQRLRLDKAIGLLSSKESITVKDIAAYVGMETNYFIRTFRKATGQTPDQFRRTIVHT